MPYCFVIQPFDGGKFDKRFDDVFELAIKGAGFEAYRVDRDPSASVPISQIEAKIQGAAMCFADITLDNPNVWFEVGYALASSKELCLVCSKERVSKFPFDVHHRNIIHYDVDSVSDYVTLREKITERLAAIASRADTLSALASASPIKSTKGLSAYEMIVLTTIFQNREGPGFPVPHHVLKKDLEAIGYNNIALNIGVEQLLQKQMINYKHASSDFRDDYYIEYNVEELGITWIVQNLDLLDLSAKKSIAQASRSTRNKSDWTAASDQDEIPF